MLKKIDYEISTEISVLRFLLPKKWFFSKSPPVRLSVRPSVSSGILPDTANYDQLIKDKGTFEYFETLCLKICKNRETILDIWDIQ